MYEDFLEKTGCGWVAEIDGQIVAFCYADKSGRAICLSSLIVHLLSMRRLPIQAGTRYC
jgi:hypothetical protein